MPSRRRVLGTAALAGVTSVSGCSGLVASDDNRTPTSGPVDTDVRMTVRNGDRETELVRGDEFESVGGVRRIPENRFQLPMTLSAAGADSFRTGLEDAGAFEDPDSHELALYFDGEPLYSASLAPSFARDVERGAWDRRLALSFASRGRAERVRSAIAADQN